MFLFFFFNDTATTEIYTLSLHDALPIYFTDRSGRRLCANPRNGNGAVSSRAPLPDRERLRDRKSTRLNSSHSQISYAVFCLKKKKNTPTHRRNYSTDSMIDHNHKTIYNT